MTIKLTSFWFHIGTPPSNFLLLCHTNSIHVERQKYKQSPCTNATHTSLTTRLGTWVVMQMPHFSLEYAGESLTNFALRSHKAQAQIDVNIYVSLPHVHHNHHRHHQSPGFVGHARVVLNDDGPLKPGDLLADLPHLHHAREWTTGTCAMHARRSNDEELYIR